MLVTHLEEVTSKRYKVYLDEQFAFVLYRGELSRFHIKLESEVTDEVYKEIKKEVILKRAKKRTLYLLEQMLRTEQQIRTKLKQNYYTEDIIEEAISYAKSFGYINDENYARSYVTEKHLRKSKRDIYSQLLGKGIRKEVIECALEESYHEEVEIEAISKIVRKKGYDSEKSSNIDRQKVYNYLVRKGFSHANICQVLRVSEWNA